MSYPATHRTVTVVEKGKVAIQEKQLPVLGEENILVRVRSVALNPMDWKASWSSYTHPFLTLTLRASSSTGFTNQE